MSIEYFILPMLMNHFNGIITNFNTGIYLLDCMIIIIMVIIIFTIDFTEIKRDVTKIWRNYIKHQSGNSIIITTDGDLLSSKFKSVMYYISKLKNPSVYCLKENTYYQWNDNMDSKIEKNSEYIIDQLKTFKLDDDIYGIIKSDRQEKTKYNDHIEYTDMNVLRIYTRYKTLDDLQKWVNLRIIEYNKYIRSKTSDTQLLINILQKEDNSKSRGQKDNTLVVHGDHWESTITFENSYFQNNESIIKKIDFFLNNKQWYIDHGIPYNLGILLHGEPGCGKTRFIKQLMNHTKRHAIDINLNDNFDFNELKKIIYHDTIGEYIIPPHQRIIIFEDIDSMGDIVKSRDYKDKKENKEQNKKTDLSDSVESPNSVNFLQNLLVPKKEKINNNLSFLLNILDGLNECSGRIVIMTTNKIDFLDKALIRPGRIDITIEFKKCTIFDIYMMIKLFWKDSIDSIDNITEEMIKPELNNKYTSAEIINIFRSNLTITELKNFFIIQ